MFVTETPQIDERRARRRELRQIHQLDRARLLEEFERLPDSSLVSELYVAAVRGCSRALVQLERVRGDGIPFLKAPNGQVRYLKRDILRFCSEHFKSCTSTSQYWAGGGHNERA